MKKFFYGIICLAIAGLSSCNNSDPEFQIYEAIRYGVQLDNNYFKPVVAFNVYNGTLDAASSRVTRDGMPLSGTSYRSNVYEITSMDVTVTDMNGQYVFKAVSTDGQEATGSVSMAFSKAMGRIDVEDFEYNGASLKMTVTTPVENAEYYGFYFEPVVEDLTASSWTYNSFSQYTNDKAGTADNQEVRFSIDLSALTYDMYVYPAAFRGGNSSETILVRLGTKKLLKKGKSSFEE